MSASVPHEMTRKQPHGINQGYREASNRGAVSIWGTYLIEGCVRTDVPLNVLDTSVHTSSTSPLAGVLEVSTDDGVLRLAISGDRAKDLRIDLDQFLAQE